MNSVGLSVKDLFCAFCFIDFINYRGGGEGAEREKKDFSEIYLFQREHAHVFMVGGQRERGLKRSPR